MNAILTRLSFSSSLTSKLILFITLASSLSLLLASGAFIANDALMLRENRVAELSSMAEVLASNSTAVLAFEQAEPAAQLLATLRDHASITGAQLYNRDGELLASYNIDPAVVDPSQIALQAIGSSNAANGQLQVTLPIDDRGEQVGSIQLQAKSTATPGQLARYCGITVGVLLVSLLVAITLGTRVKTSISDPVLRLAAAVGQLKVDGNPPARIERPSNDEIGELYDEFNALLARVDFDEAAQHRANHAERTASQSLEEQLRLRTEQLQRANTELQASESRVRAILESVRHSEVAALNQVLEVVNEQRDDLAGFLEADRQGRQLPRQLLDSGRAVSGEREAILAELEALTGNMAAIKAALSIEQPQSHRPAAGATQVA